MSSLTRTYTRSNNILTFSFILIAFFCAITFALTLTLVFTPQAHAARDYGFLSSKYESDDNPGSIDKNTYLSGLSLQEYGVAYGAYQMGTGNAQNFAKWLKSSTNSTYKTWGKALISAGTSDKTDKKQKGYFCGTNFDKKWRSIASDNKNGFFTAQYLYCIEAYYNPAVKYWKKVNSKFDPNDYGTALRAALFSTAIQHGPYGSAYYIFANVGFKNGMSEKDLIKAIYEERARATKTKPAASANIIKSNSTSKKYGINGKYLAHFYSSSSAAQISIYNRLWNNEKADAINYCPHSKTTKAVVKFKNKNDRYVKKTTSATKCLTCGAIASSASTKKVKIAYTYKGKKLIDQSGTKVTIHNKGYYKVSASSLCLRKKAKTSAKVLAYLSKSKVIRARSVVMGTDGYYWAYIKVGSKKGYVRMNCLTPLGTSSIHKFVGDKCKYCGATSKQLSNTSAGKYKTASKLTVYKAAYLESAKVDTVAKGKKVKIVKVVKNAYKDYWGKLDSGGYVKMTTLK